MPEFEHVLKGRKVLLLELCAHNYKIIREFRNKRFVRKYLINTAQVSKAEHDSWYEQYINDETKKMYLIMYEGASVGYVHLKDIDCEKGTCEIGIVIGNRKYRRKGAASDSIITLLDFISRSFTINTISAHIIRQNKASIGLFESMGFKRIPSPTPLYLYEKRTSE